jgi:hypothetical protein
MSSMEEIIGYIRLIIKLEDVERLLQAHNK